MMCAHKHWDAGRHGCALPIDKALIVELQMFPNAAPCSVSCMELAFTGCSSHSVDLACKEPCSTTGASRSPRWQSQPHTHVSKLLQTDKRHRLLVKQARGSITCYWHAGVASWPQHLNEASLLRCLSGDQAAAQRAQPQPLMLWHLACLGEQSPAVLLQTAECQGRSACVRLPSDATAGCSHKQLEISL